MIRDMTMQIADLKHERDMTVNTYKLMTDQYYQIRNLYAEGLQK